ncbi:probable inactive protein kinase DDB_G0270444 [Zeugodacus cucurbitae]|nr:probable inactive protein kinase DDB_G0270444 [Zeugodacus cucurbitae]XP_054087827.1 probable inactive protein kinase DDB_G0270444 [Zeugodacus cucurbitae]XP_054087828.1 probable inactive protein kinase DDB_G0270444 [Zeugodacus cucurbitae]XP_054087829.1 probable inactive protein kinase DDB_G0270444 [Zeugodacus cucurbitae]XP_054087830.1 probable inactive protein kinase DDB_G0270444 [Zeugodacus cucurbitae]XP_054087831.1 probable inactive protein kinase DDB_G0270444 [Zeugodacus cucurbitae]XP_05
MVAIEHRQKSSTAATATETATSAATINIAVLSPTSSASSTSAASVTTTTTTSSIQQQQQQQQQQLKKEAAEEEKPQLVDDEVSIQKSPIKQKPAKMSQLDSPAEIQIAEKKQSHKPTAGAVSKSAVSQRNVDIKIAKKSNLDAATKELTKKVLKLDLTGKELDEFSIKSPKSPIARLPHQTSLTSSVDVEDRKTLREALYQGIFHRHRRTIFAVGSFLRMLRSRNSQYNTIRSSSEGEDVDEVR